MPPRGIRTCNPSMRVAADPRFRPPCHWNRLISIHMFAFVGTVVLLRVYINVRVVDYIIFCIALSHDPVLK